MKYDITDFLDLKDSGIEIVSVETTKAQQIVTLEKTRMIHFCDACGCRMYSKGVYVRTINHPIMQDGCRLVLKVRQRRWRCTNPECGNTENDEFSFVDPYRRNTNLSDILIVEAFQDHRLSASAIARRFNVSDTHAINTFARYVDMPRRMLTEIISIDEVHVGISKRFKYALVIQDFETGEPLDMIPSRREEITEPYFLSIPLKERDRVKYLITDMYDPYQFYIEKYFRNAKPVVDAFHVLQFINRYFLRYIRSVQHRPDDRDRRRHESLEQEFGRRIPFNHSKDYLLLKKYHWMLLKNQNELKFYPQPRMNYRLGRMMNTFDYLEWLFKIDPHFKEILKLKEKYVAFNTRHIGDPKGARKELPALIELYRQSEFSMFHEIADTLSFYSEAIINSFILSQRKDNSGKHLSRLSNGPIEAHNRIPKDMKRVGRGYLNFSHLRNRFLFSQRKNAAILASPKRLKDLLPRESDRH